MLALIVGMAMTFRSDDNKYFEITKNIEIYTNLYKELNTYYVDELDPGNLMRTGLDAMVGSLDPYTNYISESQIESYRYMTEGRYNGIGAISEKIGEYVTITELYEGEAADEAGLKVGDQIVAIDGKEARGRDEEAVNSILRGFPGTEVTLSIRRPGVEELISVDLIRGEIEVPNVPYSGFVEDKVGYVVLTAFTRNSGRNVSEAIKKLKEDKPDLQGIIIDLRGNPGGFLNEAVNICNIFIPKGELVVTTKGKVKDWDRPFKTLNQPMDTDLPVAVLIDENSASASEIVSGVMQDYDRGVLLGQRTYGKGLVQQTKDIGYNSKLKLTTAKYYIPSGRCIQSVEYEDGEPVDISEDLRGRFNTRNGRIVLDGGGVKPDIVLSQAADIPLIKSLIEQKLIFDYVTQYALQRDSIPPVEEFAFNEFDAFINFLEERNFDYETESEKVLERLEKISSKEGYDLDIAKIQASIRNAKREALQQNKEDIIEILEKEIAGRYYFQLGKIKMGLKNDEEIKEAVAVLKDTQRYEEILARKN